MQPDERDAGYLWDMLQASQDILEFTRGVSLAEYGSNKMLQMAVERGFQILGDAARRVTEAFKAAHPEIPWSSIVGHRNVIVHDYADLSLKRIWEVVEDDLPGLASILQQLVPLEP